MTVYKGSDGRWHGYVSMGLKDNGRRDRRHVSGERRADVAAKVRELEQKRDGGIAAAAGRPKTVATWLDHALKGHRQAQLEERMRAGSEW